ncbi:MAG: efflux RND transporter periplasmic adaptor subunit [Deltaproteobacteria bacterium]|nr:efflux RND transporter periplasmic adaptor subunit [Deltaproteobacteria bacterium]
MKATGFGKKLLHFLWGLFPWIIVLLIAIFIINLTEELKGEKFRLEKAKKEALQKETPDVRVITLTVMPEKVEDKIDLPASVEPYEELWVKAEVPGQVMDVKVREGQDVQEGDLLIELDNRDYLSRIDRIKANYNLAMMDYERLSGLVEKRIAAVTDLDKVNALLKDLSAQLTEANLALSRTRITAPISGKINQIIAKKGGWMGVDKQVAQILQYKMVKVSVGIPESDVAAVMNLDKAEVVIDALDGLRVTGKKHFLSRQPRTMARLYDLELVVDNPDGQILPGMFARVRLVKRVFNHALTIPLYSVISHGSESYVYIENDRRVKKRPVELGVLNGWKVHVKKGLEPGDRVIIVGHRLLNEGQMVDVVKNVSDPGEITES